jgi:soluble lytic murein transglycosylase
LKVGYRTSLTSIAANRIRIAGLLLACLTAFGHASEDSATQAVAARTLFRQAYGQVVDGAPTTDTADSPALRAYILYPYLQAARLARRLREAGPRVTASLDDETEVFLKAHAGQPVAQPLRRQWLAVLAGRSDWPRFLDHPVGAADDQALRCLGFNARIALDRLAGLEAEVVEAWLTPRSLPDCEQAFEWLRGTGTLTDALVEQRIRLALEAGNAAFARQFLPRLPAERAAPLQQWAALLEEPRRRLDALIASPLLRRMGSVLKPAARDCTVWLWRGKVLYVQLGTGQHVGPLVAADE